MMLGFGQPLFQRKRKAQSISTRGFSSVICGIACVSWLIMMPFAQRAVFSPAPLSLEQKIGQMIQVRTYADYPNLESRSFQDELQVLASSRSGSADVRVHLDGPNIFRAKIDIGGWPRSR
jgi:hypothetical protein